MSAFALACGVADVPRGEGRTAVVGGRRVAIVHADSGWFCVDAACPHLGGPLADGLVAESSIICPLHARRFDLATGEPLGHDCAAVTAHDVEVRGDGVYVRLREVAALAA